MSNALRYPGQWQISAEDKEALRLFVERAEEFRSLGTYGYPVRAMFGVRDGQAFSEAELPDELHLRVAAQAARHFWLQREPSHFGKICNLLTLATTEQRFLDEIVRVRQSYKDRLNSQLKPDGGDAAVRTRAQLIDAYFNGAYFHSDPEHREFVRAQEAHGWGPLVKQVFAQSLMAIRRHVLSLLPVVENALGVDQMAPCPTSKRIQQVLAEHGLGPAIILVRDCRDCSADPPTVTRKCEIDLRLPEDKISVVVERALQLIREALPTYPEYSVEWIGADGLPCGIASPRLGS